MTRPMPSQDRLRELFDYEFGQLFWKVKTGRKAKVGKAVGSRRPDGYVNVGVEGVRYYRHRLVWVWHNGQVPEGLIVDHVNNVSGDDRIENLQLITRRENNIKDKKPRSLPCCVRQVGKRFHVSVSDQYLGSFSTAEEAVAARDLWLSSVD